MLRDERNTLTIDPTSALSDEQAELFEAFLTQQESIPLRKKKKKFVFLNGTEHHLHPSIQINDNVYDSIKFTHTIKYYKKRGNKIIYSVIDNKQPSGIGASAEFRDVIGRV